MLKKYFIFWAAVTVASQTLASATTSTSASSLPQGMVVLSAAAGSTTYLSLPLSSNAIYTGIVGAVAANTISVSGTSVFSTNFATVTAPYFVKMLTGYEKGRMLLITANTSTVLTVSTTDDSSQTTSLLTLGFSVNPGDSFEIVPGDTITAIFGANTKASPLTLSGATSYASADWVNIYNPSTTSWQVYFFDTALGYWTLEGSTVNANNTVLFPDDGLSITRHSTSEPAASLVLTGRVAEVPVMTKTVGSNAIMYGSTGYPIGMKLSQINFGANWVKGTTTATADVVSVWNAATKTFSSYYQMPDSTWRLSGNTTTDMSSTILPAGGCIAIQQHLTVSGSSSYLPSTMPYTVANF